MTSTDSFISHPLVLSVYEDLMPMLRQAAEDLKARAMRSKSWPRKRSTPATMPQPYSYSYGVFYHVNSLTNAVENLDKITILMRSFRNTRTYEKNSITRATWIKYHYANYTSTLVSLFDISLIVTNHVFQLGLSDRASTSGRILTDSSVLRTNVANRLHRLAKLGSQFKIARNLHLHRGQLPDIAQLEELDIISHLQLQDPDQFIESRQLTRLFSMATRAIIQELRPVSVTNRIAVRRFLDAILPQYKSRRKQLIGRNHQ